MNYLFSQALWFLSFMVLDCSNLSCILWDNPSNCLGVWGGSSCGGTANQSLFLSLVTKRTLIDKKLYFKHCDEGVRKYCNVCTEAWQYLKFISETSELPLNFFSIPNPQHQINTTLYPLCLHKMLRTHSRCSSPSSGPNHFSPRPLKWASKWSC